MMQYKRKEERKEKMAKGKEGTSVSGRNATGNAHQCATRTKPKGKCPTEKGENITKMKRNTERKEAAAKGRQGTSMRGRCLLFCFCVFTFSMQYNEYRISKYWVLSSTDTRKY